MKAVLVDTSAWVHYFREKHSPESEIIDGFIEDGAVCTTGVVIAELLSGARNKRDASRLKKLLSIMPFLEVTEPIWYRAGEYRSRMRRKGFVAGIPDTIIAAVAAHYEVQLYTLDNHFSRINEFFPVGLIT